QLAAWSEATRRAMAFRDRVGDDRFADVFHADLQVDPLGALAKAYERLDLPFPASSEQAVTAWAGAHPPGCHGSHEVDLADFNLSADQVHTAFADYLDRFGS
ncbi:MAG: sulfotransferase, partial [Acidimicrobiia bacterium]|nr:sulfotransferase [Acidimicrobiia bacterium]